VGLLHTNIMANGGHWPREVLSGPLPEWYKVKRMGSGSPGP